MINTNTKQEISYSDNSHLFGIPILIKQHDDAFVEIERKDLCEWIEKTKDFLGIIEFHFQYRQ